MDEGLNHEGKIHPHLHNHNLLLSPPVSDKPDRVEARVNTCEGEAEKGACQEG